MDSPGCLATTILTAFWIAGQTAVLAQAQAQDAHSGKMRITGSSTVVRYSGWEKDLIDKDPSLKHWTWMPIDSYRYRTKAIPLPERSKSVYAKPIHVNTVARGCHSNPYVHIESLADRGVQAAMLPRRKSNPYVHIETYAGMSHSDVQAQLSRQSVSGKLAQPAPVAVYGDAYGALRPQSSARGSMLNERRDVYGRIRGAK